MFKDKLDEMFGEQHKLTEHATEPGQVYQHEEEEFEKDVPESTGEKDPFAAMLDEVLTAEGVDVSLEMRRKYNPTAKDVRVHEWNTERESIYSCDAYKFRCKRCFKWVTVGREQTIDDAMREQDVNPDCGMAVITDTMES
jgi:hypothetical protein